MMNVCTVTQMEVLRTAAIIVAKQIAASVKRKERPMKIFKTEQEAKAYGEEHLTKNTHELVSINGSLYILCDTDRVNEDILYGNAYKMMKQFIDTFEDALLEDVLDLHDFALVIRDWVEGYLELLGIKFLDIHDEY